MAVKFVVAHRADPNNVGDIASNPLQYFLPSDEYKVIDIAHIGRHDYPNNIPLILGGGGLFGNENFGNDYIRDLLQSTDRTQLERMFAESWNIKNFKNQELFESFYERYQGLMQEMLDKIEKVTAPRFVWGAGINSEDDIKDLVEIKWPKALANYRLVGIRDYGNSSKFPWVPCASCMHQAFDKKYQIKNDIIFFEHKKQLIKATEFGSDSIPRFVNSGGNIEQTIELLGSANTILTNSYHGAYWGTLLGKRVIVIGGAWSNKFNFLRHKVPIVGKKEDWRTYINHDKIYPAALEECRSATRNWWKKIQECL